MSGYAGELFVKITPDASGFESSLQKQVGKGGDQFAAQVKQQAATESAYKRTTTAGLSLAQVESQLADLAVLRATASKAATGQLDAEIVALRQQQAALIASAAASQQAAAAERRHADQANQGIIRLRGSAKFFSGTSLKFAGAATVGLAARNAILDGAAALQAQGGAYERIGKGIQAVLSLDPVGLFQALNQHAKSYADQLKDVAANTDSTAEDFARLAREAQNEADKLDAAQAAAARLGKSVPGFMKDAAASTQVAAEMAQEYADKLTKARHEAEKLATQQATAERNQILTSRTPGLADNLAEAVRLRDVAKANLDKTPTNIGNLARRAAEIEFQKAKSAVLDVQNQIREQRKQLRDSNAAATAAVNESIAGRTPGLADNLSEANRQERIARERFRKASEKDARDAYRDLVEAHSKVVGIQRQIADEAKAAAQKAAEERKRRLDEARSAYQQTVSNNVERLKVAADAAGNTGRTEKALLTILSQEAKDRRLAEDQRLQYAQDLVNERQTQRAALVAAAKADIDYRKSLLDLNIQRDETLFPNNEARLRRDVNAEIRYYTRLREAARKRGKAGREAVVEYESQIVSLKGKLKGLKGGGDAFTLQQLFQEAGREAISFVSNVAPRGGVLSGQDARAAFSRTVLQNPGSDNPLVGVGQSQLTETQKQTAILGSILQVLAGKPAPAAEGFAGSLRQAEKRGSLSAIEAARIGAAYGFIVN